MIPIGTRVRFNPDCVHLFPTYEGRTGSVIGYGRHSGTVRLTIQDITWPATWPEHFWLPIPAYTPAEIVEATLSALAGAGADGN